MIVFLGILCETKGVLLVKSASASLRRAAGQVRGGGQIACRCGHLPDPKTHRRSRVYPGLDRNSGDGFEGRWCTATYAYSVLLSKVGAISGSVHELYQHLLDSFCCIGALQAFQSSIANVEETTPVLENAFFVHNG